MDKQKVAAIIEKWGDWYWNNLPAHGVYDTIQGAVDAVVALAEATLPCGHSAYYDNSYGSCVACQSAKNYEEDQEKITRLEIELEQVKTRAECVHCGAWLPIDDDHDHWRTCAEHPALGVLALLNADIDTCQDALVLVVVMKQGLQTQLVDVQAELVKVTEERDLISKLYDSLARAARLSHQAQEAKDGSSG